MATQNTDGFDPTMVVVSSVEPTVVSQSVRAKYEASFGVAPSEPGGWYREDEWQRSSYILERLRGGAALLDVGAGAGQLANMVAESQRFGAVTAFDRARFSKYIELHPTITRFDGSIEDLPFDDNEFDAVTCVEVLEHVTEDVFLPGIAELRRVCRGQLLMTVPFNEPVPLSKGHLRRFEESDVVALFPKGRYTVLSRPRMSWLLIEERLDGSGFVDLGPPTPLTERDGRFRELEAEIERLRNRKAIRIADRLGATARRARGWAGRLRAAARP